jgi:hypothetical protein
MGVHSTLGAPEHTRAGTPGNAPWYAVTRQHERHRRHRRADLHRWCVRGLSTRRLSEESQIIGGCGIRLTDERYRCIARTKERACVARNTPTWREVALHAALPRMLAFEFPNGYDTCSRTGIIVCVDHVAARMHRDG